MTETGVSFTAARRICFFLISPRFPTVTQQKRTSQEGGREGKREEEKRGGHLLALEAISRSAIIKNGEDTERVREEKCESFQKCEGAARFVDTTGD